MITSKFVNLCQLLKSSLVPDANIDIPYTISELCCKYIIGIVIIIGANSVSLYITERRIPSLNKYCLLV